MLLKADDRGRGPAVVLLHGYPLNRTMWTELAERLADRRRVITPDLPGHGESDAPASVYTMEWMASSVLETVDALGVREPFVVGGLSMGGYVAQALAVDHARRLRGLILLNTRAIGDDPEQAQTREAAAAEIERTGNVEAVARSMIPRLLAPGSIAANPALRERVERMMLGTSVTGIAGALRGMAVRPDRRDDLPRIPLPTCVIAGDQDAIVPLPEAQAIASALPTARLVVVAGAGHLTPLETPTAVFQAVSHYLDDLDRSNPAD